MKDATLPKASSVVFLLVFVFCFSQAGWRQVTITSGTLNIIKASPGTTTANGTLTSIDPNIAINQDDKIAFTGLTAAGTSVLVVT